jgi:hypothetical protein
MLLRQSIYDYWLAPDWTIAGADLRVPILPKASDRPMGQFAAYAECGGLKFPR